MFRRFLQIPIANITALSVAPAPVAAVCAPPDDNSLFGVVMTVLVVVLFATSLFFYLELRHLRSQGGGSGGGDGSGRGGEGGVRGFTSDNQIDISERPRDDDTTNSPLGHDVETIELSPMSSTYAKVNTKEKNDAAGGSVLRL